MNTSILAGRTTGAFPLSIATSLALESIFSGRQAPYDPERQIPQQIDINKYQEIYISLSTLFRNIVGAIDRKEITLLTPHEISNTLAQEIDLIHSIFSVEGHNVCRPVFYFCTYDSVYTKNRHQAVQLRIDKTEGQKFNTQLLMKTMKVFFNEHKEAGHLQLDSEIRPMHPSNALIITHVPHDLLSYPNFKRLDLLETHTGKLKPRNLWYTKYCPVGDAELNTLPFNRKFLMIFGDHVIYTPMDIRLRRLILDISVKRHWTPLTTDAKVLQDLDLDVKERYIVELFKIL